METELTTKLRELRDMCIRHGEHHSIPNETAHWLIVGATSEIDAKISMARSHTAVAVAEARKAGLLPSPPSPPTAQKP